MLDQLESAGDPDIVRGRLPRRVAIALVVLIVGAATALGTYDLTRPTTHRRVAAPPVPRPSPRPLAKSCANADASAPVTAPEPDWPTIDAPVGRGPTGLSVLASNVTPLLHVDLATGVVSRPVECVGEVDQASPVDVSWARVLNVSDAGVRRVYRVDDSQHLQQVPGDYAVAGRGGTVLVISATATGQHVARYADATWTPSITPLGDGLIVIGETSVGLIAEDVDVPQQWVPTQLVVADPRTGAVTQTLGGQSDARAVIAGERVAWLEPAPCSSSCTLRVYDPRTGSGRTISVPRTTDPSTINVAASPDGASIALSYVATTSYPGSSALNGHADAGSVVVVSVSNGTTRQIGGMTTTGNGQPLGVTWSVDSRWLVLDSANSIFSRFAVWDGRTHELRAMPWVVAKDLSSDSLSTVHPARNGQPSAWG